MHPKYYDDKFLVVIKTFGYFASYLLCNAKAS